MMILTDKYAVERVEIRTGEEDLMNEIRIDTREVHTTKLSRLKLK